MDGEFEQSEHTQKPTLGSGGGGGHWTPDRVRLRDWLRELHNLVDGKLVTGAGLAELYIGAVELLYHRTVTGWSRFVCHAVREICNNLPDLLSEPVTGRAQYYQLVERLGVAWKMHGLPLRPVAKNEYDDLPPISGRPRMSIPDDVVRCIWTLFDEHEGASERNREKVRRMVMGLVPEDERDAPDVELIAKEFLNTTKDWAVGGAHKWMCIDSSESFTGLKGRFERFESYLMGLTEDNVEQDDELDGILAETNRQRD